MTVRVAQRCRGCDFAPGEGIGGDSALKAMLSDYLEIGAEHAAKNRGHAVETLVNGELKRLHYFGASPAGSVRCDQCATPIPKAEAIGWEDITLCPRCAGLDPCACSHDRASHQPFEGECNVCPCEKFRGES